MTDIQNELSEVLDDERLIMEELHEDEKKIDLAYFAIGILFLIVFIGIVYLVSLQAKEKNAISIVSQSTPSLSSVSTITSTESPQPTLTPSSIPKIALNQVPEESPIKEYFIPFGTGSSQENEWADVSGMQANIDFGNYKNIKEIRFEVSVTVPTANQTVSARLFNVTDKHEVWNSEVTASNNMYVTSPPIIYDKGPKIYQVQMKTQLGYVANLTQARLHIVLK